MRAAFTILLLVFSLQPSVFAVIHADGPRDASSWRLRSLCTITDSNVLAYQTNFLANGGSVSAETLCILQEMTQRLYASNLWTKLTFVHVFSGNDLKSGLETLFKYPAGSSAYVTNGRAAFTSQDFMERGYRGGLKPNGYSNYVITAYNPVAQSASATSFHISAYVAGVEPITNAEHTIAGISSSGGSQTRMAGTNNPFGAIVANSATQYAPVGGSSVSQGLLLVTVNGDKTNIFYQNGVHEGTDFLASGSHINTNFFLAAMNNQIGASKGPTLYSSQFLRWFSLGTGLSAADASALNSVVAWLQTQLGRTYDAAAPSDCFAGTYTALNGGADNTQVTASNMLASTKYSYQGGQWHVDATLYGTNLFPGGILFSSAAQMDLLTPFTLCDNGTVTGTGDGIGIVAAMTTNAFYAPCYYQPTLFTNRASLGGWIKWNYSPTVGLNSDTYNIQGYSTAGGTPYINLMIMGTGNIQMEVNAVGGCSPISTNILSPNVPYWANLIFDRSGAADACQRLFMLEYGTNEVVALVCTNASTIVTNIERIQLGQRNNNDGNTNNLTYFDNMKWQLGTTNRLYP